MSRMISYCGINCTTCDARIATVNNDDELRQKVAEKWKVAFGFECTPDMIQCTGCRIEGAKIGHWHECEIRLCADERKYEHCGICAELNDCKKIRFVLDSLPEAIDNLKSLK